RRDTPGARTARSPEAGERAAGEGAAGGVPRRVAGAAGEPHARALRAVAEARQRAPGRKGARRRDGRPARRPLRRPDEWREVLGELIGPDSRVLTCSDLLPIL